MRTFRRIVGAVIAFLLVTVLLTVLFTPPSGIRVLLKQAKSTEYDTLILGQSHAECGYNPYIISDELGVNAVSAARRITPMNNIYYILEEADVDKHYKTVILDIDPYYWRLDQTRDTGTDMNLFPYLSGMRKYHYFREAIWPNVFTMLFCDYYISLENMQKIPLALKTKFSKDYIENVDSAMVYVDEYLASDKAYDYMGRGFLRGKDYANQNGWEEWEFNNDVEQDNIDYLQRMKNYCDDNGIRLVCVQSALIPSRIKTQNMGAVHDYFDNMLGAMGIEFYDFNYGKSEYLHRTEYDYVDADGHMMGGIADRQSDLLCKVMTSDDPSQYFYNNYDEVLAHIDD